jgi:hypothetical protein
MAWHTAFLFAVGSELALCSLIERLGNNGRDAARDFLHVRMLYSFELTVLCSCILLFAYHQDADVRFVPEIVVDGRCCPMLPRFLIGVSRLGCSRYPICL